MTVLRRGHRAYVSLASESEASATVEEKLNDIASDFRAGA